jgi:filamentous hemagglutinin
MSPTQQWAANTRFLDRLITRGDEVLLATNAADARAGTFFARELEYLISRGYTLTSDGWRLLPPGM